MNFCAFSHAQQGDVKIPSYNQLRGLDLKVWEEKKSFFFTCYKIMLAKIVRSCIIISSIMLKLTNKPGFWWFSFKPRPRKIISFLKGVLILKLFLTLNLDNYHY